MMLNKRVQPLLSNGTLNLGYVLAMPASLRFRAYPKKGPPSEASASIKVAMVAADCLLIGIAPVLTQLSKSASGGYAYNPVAVNFSVELAKAAVAYVALMTWGTRANRAVALSPSAFLRAAWTCRMLALPSAMYAANNYLKFILQLFFSPTSAKMISNMKILTIAVLLRFIMGRKFSLYQWEALYLLVAGITVNQLANCDGTGNAVPSLHAMGAMAGTITLPSLASVCNEYGFKGDQETHVLVQVLFLYVYGLLANSVALILFACSGGPSLIRIFDGMSFWVVLLVINNTCQGTLASFFYKYADTILKKYSSTLATILTALVSAVVFAHAISVNFIIGISVVCISMHQFFSLGASTEGMVPRSQVQTSPSVEHFVDRPSASSATHETQPLLPR